MRKGYAPKKTVRAPTNAKNLVSLSQSLFIENCYLGNRKPATGSQLAPGVRVSPYGG